MGAVECRSTRLCAYSGRRCKRAIGARRLAHALNPHCGTVEPPFSPLTAFCVLRKHSKGEKEN